MRTPEVAVLVIVVSSNDGRWLEACLESLSPVRGQVDVIVVANACDDETEQICARAELNLTVLRTNARLGFAACNNRALLKALEEGYEYAFLLNPDTRVHLSAINALLDFMNSRPEVGIAGSLQTEYGDETWTSLNEWSRQTTAHAVELGSRPEHDGRFTWIEHNYVQGAAMMLRLKLARQVGLLDPAYRTFYEETDLCRRCLLAGQKVAILFNSKVQHYGGGNWKSDQTRRRKRDRLFLRNQFMYYLSGAGSVTQMALAAVAILGRQLKTVWLRREDVVLPRWQYAGILFMVMGRLTDIFRLYRRNQMIRSGGTVPVSLWQIGTDPAES